VIETPGAAALRRVGSRWQTRGMSSKLGLTALVLLACGGPPPQSATSGGGAGGNGDTGGTGGGASSCAPFPAWNPDRTTGNLLFDLFVGQAIEDHGGAYDTLSLTAKLDPSGAVPQSVADLSTTGEIAACAFCVDRCENCTRDGGSPTCERCYLATAGSATSALTGSFDAGTLTLTLDDVTFTETAGFGTAAPVGACYQLQHLEQVIQLPR
jgi:hypothetical protein